MVFAMISEAGTGPLVRLHGKINATVYKKYWRNMLYLTWELQFNKPAVFMQDNAPCHSAKTFLSDEDVTVIEKPAQSPDRNPIENVWKLQNERA